jgi:DNA polymerase sigma
MTTVPDDLGEILLYFLEYFGNKFDPKKSGINIINRESLFVLENNNEHAVTIDPVDHNNNVTRASYRIEEVLRAFSQVHVRLKEILNKGKSRNLLKQAFKKLN